MINHTLLGLDRRPPGKAVCDIDIHQNMAATSGHICFGKGSSSPAPTTTTVNQNSIPSWAQPYLTQALSQGQALAQNAYTPYPGQQLADLTSQQYGAVGMAQNLPNVAGPTFGLGQQFLTNAAQGGANAANYQPQQVSSPYNFQQQNWTSPGVAQSFMDPYQSAVTQQTINQINQQAGIQNAQIQANAAASGSFGGDRQQVAQNLNNYYTQQAVGQAAAAGGQSAYTTGQQQFNTQQALAQQAQAAGAQYGLGAQTANQAAAYQAAQLGLAGAGLQGTAGQDLGYLGTSMQNAGLQNQQALQTSGALLQAQQQSADNIAYQNFLNQLNFPYQQVGFEAGLVNGLPLGNVGTAATYQNPSMVSQMLGLGLGGLGLSQALGGGSSGLT